MSENERAAIFTVALRFHGDLPFFLKRNESGGAVTRALREKTSVKDVIESCGVPHPEVDLILRDGAPIDFASHVTKECRLDVYPVSAVADQHRAHRLQRGHLKRFVVDGHLGKLARNLRLLGFDTAYQNDADDALLVQIARDEERALLTRDRRLLMHRAVRDGFCPRSQFADEQLLQVIRRFELRDAMRPYTRCLRCNGTLEQVDKAAVLHQLEPLTKLYYNDFRGCAECDAVYWSGSHRDKLDALVERIKAQLAH